jgi:hypothetical protein
MTAAGQILPFWHQQPAGAQDCAAELMRRVASLACGPRRLCAMLGTAEPLSFVISLNPMEGGE